MAKKEEQQKATAFTDQILAEIEKDYGTGVMVAGEDAVNEYRQVIPWSPSLDAILSGGIEEGSWVGITGHEKHGKTSAALAFAANAQKPEYGSRPVYYSKVEGRLSMKFLKQTQGLDLSRGKFNIIQSSEDKILTGQEHLKILVNVIKTVPNAVVIIDSISALCEEKEMNEGIGTETRGGGAKMFGLFCRLLNQVVPVRKTIVIGITQLISNTSGMGAQYMERAARMWKYQCDYQIRALMKTAWEAGEKQIGLKIKWVCNTSKQGKPGMTMEGNLRFGLGVDRLNETLNIAFAVGLIKKTGAWYSLSYLENHLPAKTTLPKFQGSEKVYEALSSNPEWAAILEKEVAVMTGGLAGEGGGE